MEERRHNVAVEQESQRYNKVVNAQNQYALEESKRHNLEQELIGLKQAQASLASAAAAQLSAAANMRNAVTREAELQETIRINNINAEREYMVAQARAAEYMSTADLNAAKANLTAAETLTEYGKTTLTWEQVETEQRKQNNITSQTVLNYTHAVETGLDTTVGLIKDISGYSSLNTLIDALAS